MHTHILRVKKRLLCKETNFQNLDGLLHQLSFRHRYISLGIKAAPVILRVSRGRRCVRPWTDNGLRIVDLWGNFSSPTARAATLVPPVGETRRKEILLSAHCLRICWNVLLLPIMRVITTMRALYHGHLFIGEATRERRGPHSPAREGTREIKFSHSW